MDLVQGAVMIAAMICAVIVFAIHKASARAADERRIKHIEFEARLKPEHEETVMRIQAGRDAEVAKAIKAEPKPMIEIKAAD